MSLGASLAYVYPTWGVTTVDREGVLFPDEYPSLTGAVSLSVVVWRPRVPDR